MCYNIYVVIFTFYYYFFNKYNEHSHLYCCMYSHSKFINLIYIYIYKKLDESYLISLII